MKTIPVASSLGDYEIRIRTGLISSLGHILRDLFPERRASRIGIVSNPLVWDLYGKNILESVSVAGLTPVIALHPDGEISKNIASVMDLLTVFLENRWERREPIPVAPFANRRHFVVS